MPHEDIKPSHKPIKDYYAALEALRGQGGKRETELRAAFQELLSKLARQRGWTFMPERPINRDGKRVVPDGTLLDEGVPLGHWEAKDGDDKLAIEVKKKIEKGYPTDNIIFEDTHQAIHYQNGIELKTKNLYEPAELCLLLNQFFAYEKPVQQSFKQALAKFREDVPVLAQHLQEELKKAHANNTGFKKAFGDFFELCKSSLNPSISQSTVDEMLVQHLLTERIFRKVFHQEDFTRRNVIANEVEKVIDALKAQEFDRSKFLKGLDYFYKAIEAQAEDMGDYSEKQELLNTVYERFFQDYSVKVADTHGIVYTPQAIVDFMCASVDEVLQKEFGATLGGKDVNILDPCTGTGNFIVNLIRRIPRADLERVYKHQLFANEILLLPYYIAALNIEHAYWERTKEYESFEGLCFVDTLELAESKQKGLSFMTKENAQRVERQRKAPITVIIGNPPYRTQQESENDNNKNRRYAQVDSRIQATYVKDSSATLRSKLYDPYLRFFRWASDRIGDEGVIVFVSNNYFVDGLAFDGVRKHLAKDFSKVLILDLKGNVRKDSMREGIPIGEEHTVFGLGAMVGVSVNIFIKSKKDTKHRILYSEVDWRATRFEKFSLIKRIGNIYKSSLTPIAPDLRGNWLAAANEDDFGTFPSIASKAAKAGASRTETIFTTYSHGVSTNRDSVVYDFDRTSLDKRLAAFADAYNSELDRFNRKGQGKDLDDFLDYSKVKWSRNLKSALKRHKELDYFGGHIRRALYRPFTEKWLYLADIAVDESGRFPSFFPLNVRDTANQVLCVSDIGYRADTYNVMVGNCPVDLHLGASLDGHQCFPFYVYDEDGKNRRENITDWALKTFREAYADKTISKWDIFYYVYAMLHHRGYREKFKDCLKRELPRIPFAGFVGATHGSPAKKGKGRATHASPLQDFKAFAAAGEKLAKLHLDYERAEPWPLTESIKEGAKNRDLWHVEKMRLAKDKKSLTVNEWLTLSGIPERCFEYRLGNRSALDWVIDQYQVSEDKKSGIRSDPNREDDPQYIVRLVKQVIRVSMETLDIIDSLPESYGGPLPP
ncbi:MAG: N-6 DNA methylase [Planctomycetes bacterium]|nr:N-6 DNA methylase [Planctomycetota bacterium]